MCRGRQVASPDIKERIIDLWWRAAHEGLCAIPDCRAGDQIEFAFSTTGLSLLLKIQGPTSRRALQAALGQANTQSRMFACASPLHAYAVLVNLH